MWRLVVLAALLLCGRAVAGPLPLSPYAILGQPAGSAALNCANHICVDVSRRPPEPTDDSQYYGADDGYNGRYTDSVSFGPLWGYADPVLGYQEYQMQQPGYQKAVWNKVSAPLPCDGFQVLACASSWSLYDLTNSFSSSTATLYRLNAAGAQVSYAMPAAVYSRGADWLFAGATAFCSGTTHFYPNDCYAVPVDEYGNTLTTDWSIATIAIASASATSVTSVGTTMTVAGTCSGNSIFQPHMVITSGAGFAAGTYIVSDGSGAGCAGTYTISAAATVGTGEAVTVQGVGTSGNVTITHISLDMNGCGSVGTAAVINVTIAGGILTPTGLSITPTPGNSSANIGECIGAAGSATQNGLAGGFTIKPVLAAVWLPTYGCTFPSQANVNGLRGLICNSQPLAYGNVPTGTLMQNKLYRVAGVSYTSNSSWFAMLGQSLMSAGGQGGSGGNGVIIQTTDGNYGVNAGGQGVQGIQSVHSNSDVCQNAAGTHTTRMQADNPSVTLVNLNSSETDCHNGNDYVTSPTWAGETTTGYIFGSPSYTLGSGINAFSLMGDVVAFAMGTTPAAAGTANSYLDQNKVLIGLTQFGQLTPQSDATIIISGSNDAMNGGDETNGSWVRLVEEDLRPSGNGRIGVRGYNQSGTGLSMAADLVRFNLPRGMGQVYYDGGCDSAPVCVMELLGLRVELEAYCTSASSGSSCVSQCDTASVSGTTLTTSAADCSVAIGSVVAGGTLTPFTVTGFSPNEAGGPGTYTGTPSQTASCTACVVTTTSAQVAAFASGEYKFFAYSAHQLGSGYYAVTAALPSAAGISGMHAGDQITLTPPSGSGETCAIATGVNYTTVASKPVLSVATVSSGVPISWNILGPFPAHGACYGGNLPACTPSFSNQCLFTQSGWVPSGGSGSWGSATFTLTLRHQTVPSVPVPVFYLQADTLPNSYMLNVVQSVSLGGAGLYDDIYANWNKAQPTPCAGVGTCSFLGSGYGADAVHDQFGGECNLGACNYTLSGFNNSNYVATSEQPNSYGQKLTSATWKAMLLPLMPFQ